MSRPVRSPGLALFLAAACGFVVSAAFFLWEIGLRPDLPSAMHSVTLPAEAAGDGPSWSWLPQFWWCGWRGPACRLAA